MNNSAQHPKTVTWRAWISRRIFRRPVSRPTSRLWFGSLGLGGLLLTLYFTLPIFTVGGGEALSGPAAQSSIIRVMARPLVQSLGVVGKVEPGNVVSITAPFDGPIKESLVNFGSRVERGQVMLVLDAGEVELHMRDAEVNAIKATQKVAELKNWANGSEVLRAKNSMLSVQIRVDELTRKEHDSKTLLVRGIIPRNEFEATANELKAQKLQLKAAHQDLEAVLKKGDGEHQYLAALQLKNATKRLEELQRQIADGNVKAPVSGLVLRPTATSGGKDSTPADIQVGSRLSKGQALMTVADTQTLKIRAQVNEIDVNRIHEGQTVRVTGDAFGTTSLRGEVVQISAEASGSRSSRGAAFEVVVAVASLTPDQRKRVRIGMSANLTIVIYENVQAVVVPVGAVHIGPGGNFAITVNPTTHKQTNVPVTIGRSTEGGVEILAGLKSGDSIVVEGGAVLQQPLLGSGQLGMRPGGGPPQMLGGPGFVGM
ncbi:MAG: HlyD family secretion protein [Rhodospirillaceae bacterium]|nr:MAG: HlyD family secretion protein [Rhodospirillaceae bacterium]